MLTQAKVRELFDYDAAAGELIWKIKRKSVNPGDLTGRKVSIHGYRMVMIDRKEYRAHRIIWLWHYGELTAEIDHLDRDKLNNRIENLRAATRSQNKGNTNKRNQETSSRWKGVCFDKSKGKWLASIRMNGRHKTLGRFADEEDAARAYNAAAIEVFGSFARLNEVPP